MELIGDVAHELRTPLASIRSSMEGLVDGVLPAEPETYLSVEREASRLQRLVRDLEELSRAEAGQIALDLQPVLLGDLVKAVAERLALQFEDKGVTLEVNVSASPLPVKVDSSRITQVLTNLLGNALQYTPESGRVTVGTWAEGPEALVSIHDTGIGIAREHLPHLFERFYRVDKSRSRAGGGSGIGLTIARHLIEAHGGLIWAESEGPGQGSTFTIALPLAP
jgi:histidine kinase